MKQVFLFIGIPPIISNSIQIFLHNNRKYLAELGYLYPTQKKAHHNLVNLIADLPNANREADTWADVIKEIDKSPADRIIISSEKFSQIDSEDIIRQVARQLKKYEVKIVVYLERQDKMKASSFDRALREGAYASEIDFFLQEAKDTSYLNLLNNWGQIFGKDKIIVHPVENDRLEDIYSKFLSCIGIDSIENFNLPQDKTGQPNLAQIIAVNFINQMTGVKIGLPKEGFHRFNVRAKASLSDKYPQSFFQITQHWQAKQQYNFLPYEIALDILEKSREDNLTIAKQYLNRQDGKLFDESIDPYRCESLDINNLEREQLLDLCSYLVKNQISN